MSNSELKSELKSLLNSNRYGLLYHAVNRLYKENEKAAIRYLVDSCEYETREFDIPEKSEWFALIREYCDSTVKHGSYEYGIIWNKICNTYEDIRGGGRVWKMYNCPHIYLQEVVKTISYVFPVIAKVYYGNPVDCCINAITLMHTNIYFLSSTCTNIKDEQCQNIREQTINRQIQMFDEFLDREF